MTTPAQDAPLVFPSVAFRPVRLFAICILLTGLATLAAGLLGHVMVGVFFGVGLVLGLLNAVLVQRSVDAITADAHPLKRKMALNSATRLVGADGDRADDRVYLPTAGPRRVVRHGPVPGGVGDIHRAAGDEEAEGR